MLSKFKNVFVAFVVLCFSFTALSAAQNESPKTLKLFSKMKSKKANKKKVVKKNCSCSQNKDFSPIKKNDEPRIFNEEIFNGTVVENLDYDVNLSEDQMFCEAIFSAFGNSCFFSNQKILEGLKEIFGDCGPIDQEFMFGISQNFGSKNFDDFLLDLNKLNSFLSFIYQDNIVAAEEILNDIENENLKNFGLGLFFNLFLDKKDPQNAERIFSLMTFSNDSSEFDDEDDSFDFIEALIISYMQNKDFESAERLANLEQNEEWDRNQALLHIVKYYTRINDLENAKRIIDEISQKYEKDEATIYILDCYARQKKFQEFKNIVFSSNDIEFKKRAVFILAIYQNNLDEAIQNKPSYYESIIENFIEILCSSNHIKEAEDIINIFGDEYDKDNYKLFMINAYLKNGKIEDAKRLKDEISNDELIEKWLVSKLIENYQKKII